MSLPRGVLTALLTPFRDGRVYMPAYEADLARQVNGGIDGLVACGTTAEAPTLSAEERDWLIRAAVVAADGKIPVLAGTGTNDTMSTITATRSAHKLGADAVLVVTPYYSRPTQEGLFRHFEAIAAAADIPIVLYNVPARTGVDLEIETIARLARIDNIVGIKDAAGSSDRSSAVLAAVGEKFRMYCGDDALTLRALQAGADGAIAVISNAYPAEWRAMCHAAIAGKLGEAQQLHDRIAALLAALSLESNPAPIKYLMSLTHQGHSNELRLPLVPVSRSTAAAIRSALDRFTADVPDIAATAERISMEAPRADSLRS
jgi:4-hydroxy-tetrahydrodipicolinate synthase